MGVKSANNLTAKDMLSAFLSGRDNVDSAQEIKQIPSIENGGEEIPRQSPQKPMKVVSPRSTNDDRPALKDDPKYSRYFRMLKVGMPLDVVKHSMKRDGLDESVMDGDHKKPAFLGIPLKDDPKYKKYFMMLKIGMPIDAVKHFMTKDGLDPTLLDGDHNLPAPT